MRVVSILTISHPYYLSSRRFHNLVRIIMPIGRYVGAELLLVHARDIGLPENIEVKDLGARVWRLGRRRPTMIASSRDLY